MPALNWRLDPAVVPPERGRTETGPDYSCRVGLGDFPAGTYPACEVHGALLCMTPPHPDKPQIWRCDACGAGAVWQRESVKRELKAL